MEWSDVPEVTQLVGWALWDLTESLTCGECRGKPLP